MRTLVLDGTPPAAVSGAKPLPPRELLPQPPAGVQLNYQHEEVTP